MALTPNPLPQGEGLLGGPAVREEGLRNDDYPLSRPLLMYTNGEPKGDVRDYIRWIGSDAGQCILIEKGYAPVRDVECSEGARSHG
jgi:ABC-type phosphate transport system substrate-binding protein